MSYTFQGTYGLIYVEAHLLGPASASTVRLILDTGSTDTVLSRRVARLIGFDLDEAESRQVELVTASGIVFASVITVNEIHALGYTVSNEAVLVYDMPGDQKAEGVLGLSFLRRMRLTIDFHREQIWLRYGTLPVETND